MRGEDAKQPHLLENKVFSIKDEKDFTDLAIRIFNFQFFNNPVYEEFCRLIGKTPENVNKLVDIPFLPVEFFKNHDVLSHKEPCDKLFLSSGTSNMQRSKHYVKKLSLYHKSFLKAFRQFYGNPEKYCILSLLPGYHENENSSLIYMVRELIRQSGHPDSGFYMEEKDQLIENLIALDQAGQPVILIGVSFALLSLAEKYSHSFNHLIVIETGGMKGRRKEITREELHTVLKNAFGLEQIHSEYGMAELLSQAYSLKDGFFYTPPWMQIFIREYYDPLSVGKIKRSGGINIIDLANLYTCSFIETKDIGRKHHDGSFEVLGRFDYSEIRGCNLMAMD